MTSGKILTVKAPNKSTKRLSAYLITALVLLITASTCNRSEAKAESKATNTNIPLKLSALLSAYPAMIRSVSETSVEMNDGTVFDYIPRTASYETMLNETTLYDQLLQTYPCGLPKAPEINSDPGRFRFDPFFKSMYGATEAEVIKNLVAITWMPGIDGTTIKVTRVNGVDGHLRKVSEKLSLLPPEIRNFARNPATFNWRVIEDTDRLSAHAYGIAIDIGVARSHYWLWDKKKGFYKWPEDFPYEIVEIFESEGFIWGGRWYHYDTMHFEYRPELLPAP